MKGFPIGGFCGFHGLGAFEKGLKSGFLVYQVGGNVGGFRV